MEKSNEEVYLFENRERSKTFPPGTKLTGSEMSSGLAEWIENAVIYEGINKTDVGLYNTLAINFLKERYPGRSIDTKLVYSFLLFMRDDTKPRRDNNKSYGTFEGFDFQRE